ncbi:MAG: helix-turn-helix domain-containing protein [Deltaproteobacteria bacterium]|nr:helix-turn-helix domain-containing protein [Deltaproteobacteria bacterium]
MPSKIRDIILYSVPELSQALNVTTVTVRKYLKQGKLKGKKVMGRWFISGEEVTEFFTNTPMISDKRSSK